MIHDMAEACGGALCAAAAKDALRLAQQSLAAEWGQAPLGFWRLPVTLPAVKSGLSESHCMARGSHVVFRREPADAVQHEPRARAVGYCVLVMRAGSCHGSKRSNPLQSFVCQWSVWWWVSFMR